MLYRLIFAGFLLSGSILSGQEIPMNAKLLAHIPLPENGSGVWGYEDKNGIPYAVIGDFRNAWVYSVEDPENPVLRHKAPGFPSIWREIRGYGDNIYVVNDRGADGLLVIDMSKAPDTITHNFYTPQITVGQVTKNLERCHTIFIDENGFLYLMGCNISRGGVLIFDLNVSPTEPPLVGYADLEYSHDAYARGDTLWSAEILAGFFAVYDVSDKSSPKLLARQVTSRAFTHNVWLSDDGKFLFSTDERPNAFVDSYDISDLNNIQLLDKYRTLATENTGVIPHNTYYHNGFLVTSYYTDGIRIIDAHRPDNLVEVAHYDSWNDPTRCHSGFFGCWGVYPYTGSNIVYASDINNGLFIVEIDYKRACYVEGSVRDINGNPIPNARIEILGDQINRRLSDPSGYFKTGIATSGKFNVQIIHPDYQTRVYSVDLEHGQVIGLDAVLFRSRPVQFSMKTSGRDAEPLEAVIRLTNETRTYDFSTAENGTVTRSILSGTFTLYISSWGYQSLTIENFQIEDESLFAAFELVRGYEDQFNLNNGWAVQSTPGMTGIWERAIPAGTDYFGQISNPDMDDLDDFGNYAYVTGNGNQGAACNDVDNGITTLRSPIMRMRDLRNPGLNYSYWLFNDGGASLPDDTLYIKISNGIETVVVQKIGENTNGWMQTRDLKIKDLIELTDSMSIIVEISDFSPTSHIVEGGFDHFFVTVEEIPSNTNDIPVSNHWSIYPNPGTQHLHISSASAEQTEEYYEVRDVMGRVVSQGKIKGRFEKLDTHQWNPGMYLIRMENGQTIKWVKL